MPEVRTVSATGGAKGAKTARFDLIPTFVLTKLAEHYGRGALKYADHNWRKGYKWSLSYAALVRHVNAFWGGEDLDVCLGHEADCSFVTSEGKPYEDKDGKPLWIDGVECYNHTGNHHLDGVNFHGFALRYFAEFLPDYDDRFTTTVKSVTMESITPVSVSPIEVYRNTKKLLKVTDLTQTDSGPLCGHDKCINPNCKRVVE